MLDLKTFCFSSKDVHIFAMKKQKCWYFILILRKHIVSEDFDANVEYKNQGVQEIILSEKGFNFSFI